MNYLDFSQKIMLYLQLRGILFRFTVDTSSDMDVVILKKNGLPFDLAVAEKGKVDVNAINCDGKPFEIAVIESPEFDINAINGNGIIGRVNSISSEDDLDFEFINATAEIAKIERIEEKAKVLASAVIGQAINSALKISEKTSLRVMFEPFNGEPFNLHITDSDSHITALIRKANAMIAEVSKDMKATADFETVIATAMLLSMAVLGKGTAEVGATVGNGVQSAALVTAKAELRAVMKLMVKAVIADYANYTLEDMSDTLDGLSQIIEE